MKKFAIAALLAGTVLVPLAEAAQVRFSSPAWRDATYGGGEFNVDLGANGSIDFQSFCLEKNEGLDFGVNLNYTTDAGAWGGGLAGGTPDIISEGTSYLFDMFLQQTLPGYSFATGNAVANAARAASGRQLQDAIWALEEEQAVNLANPFIVMVVAQFNSIAGAMADASSGTIGVLNPTAPVSGIRRQSVLINLPDNGMAVIMLGGSLMLLGAARRRLA